LSDARRIASVLPDRIFVQMPEASQIKFKLSVAAALHSGFQKGPNLEQVNFFAAALWPLAPGR
jgi:hypothetical protein